jgi:hypothetical protein
MARLEDLIKDIADHRLREQIEREVANLKAKKKFGLVFEQHLPEVVELPGLPVKQGARVANSRRSRKREGEGDGLLDLSRRNSFLTDSNRNECYTHLFSRLDHSSCTV